MSAIVLIATTEHLASLKEREELVDAVTFSDAEALRALEVISRQRPEIVLLDRSFAETTRGLALIKRIKDDPSLGACEIRIVKDDRSYSQVAEEVAAKSASKSAAEKRLAPLDQVGTRQAPRFRIVEGVQVEIDGNPATLVDLSVIGAQVVSLTILKPNQRVRFIVPTTKPAIRLKAAVAWAAFEIPQGQSRYRAGIQLFGADAAAMTKFIDRNKK